MSRLIKTLSFGEWISLLCQKWKQILKLFCWWRMTYSKVSNALGSPCVFRTESEHRSSLRIKESHYRPGVAQRVPGGLGSQILMTFGTWTWWGLHPHVPAAFTPRMFLVLIFTRCWVDPKTMVRSEENMSLKNPVTPLGIDPGAVRLEAQRLISMEIDLFNS